MKSSRFKKEQITAVLREQEAGASTGGCVPSARHQQRDIPQVERESRWVGGIRAACLPLERIHIDEETPDGRSRLLKRPSLRPPAP